MNCGKNYQNKHRPQQLKQRIFTKYVWGKQTIKQLAQQYQRSDKWIWSQLDGAKTTPCILYPQPVVVITDVTFWGRDYGVLVFRSLDPLQNVFWYPVERETIEAYRIGKEALEELSFSFQAVVLDGRKGVRELFVGIPVQICHFHQVVTINRYLTRKPKLEAGQELRVVALTIPHTTEQVLQEALASWYTKWKVFLQEKTVDPITHHWCYTHRRIRAAYRSLHTNLPFLFTYQKYPDLHIPNTTNSLDGTFSHLKQLLRIHRGLTKNRRFKLIQEILAHKKAP